MRIILLLIPFLLFAENEEKFDDSYNRNMMEVRNKKVWLDHVNQNQDDEPCENSETCIKDK